MKLHLFTLVWLGSGLATSFACVSPAQQVELDKQRLEMGQRDCQRLGEVLRTMTHRWFVDDQMYLTTVPMVCVIP